MSDDTIATLRYVRWLNQNRKPMDQLGPSITSLYVLDTVRSHFIGSLS